MIDFQPIFPARFSAKTPVPPPAAEQQLEGRIFKALAGKLVIYFEDNPANVAFMRELCSMLEGVRLLVASTAEAGLLLIERERPDVIVMDINLPGMNGYQALAELRSQPSTSSIPIVALSAAASPLERREGARAGFDAYLTKPVNIDELLATLDRLLGGGS